MISKILHNYLNDKSRFETVFAHCDIPCKIYDPIFAQISVLTMIRLVDLIDELDISNSSSINDKAQFNRLVLCIGNRVMFNFKHKNTKCFLHFPQFFFQYISFNDF